MRVTALLVLCLVAAPAFAQATRTWVSGVGDDVNPCSRTAPCKTFAGAISKTAAGGEINALDPGSYGSVTITKAITIDAHHVLAGVLASGGNAITISAGANDVVILRGIDLKGVNAAPFGVRFVSGKALHVEDCSFEGFSTAGISFEPSVATSALFVRNTTVSNSASAAVNVAGGTATLDRVVLANGVNGVVVAGTAKVTAHAATLSGHTGAGARVSGTASLALERSVVSGNATGVQVDMGAEARLSETMLSHNVTGLSGNVLSFGNNRVAAGNGTNGAPASTLPQQ